MLVTPITKLLNIRVQVSLLTFTPGIYTHVQAKLDLLCREVCSGKYWVALRTVKVRANMSLQGRGPLACGGSL